jgi:hypothetical protein
MAKSAEASTLKIGEALPESEFQLVKQKVVALLAKGVSASVFNNWCDKTVCINCFSCANQHLSWAEYECYRKYAPEFNALGSHGVQDGYPSAHETSGTKQTKLS